MRLPFLAVGMRGSNSLISPRWSAATRLRRQMATGFSVTASPVRGRQASAAAGGFAGPIAGAAENRWKHVRFAVEHVGVGGATLCDQAYVFGDVGVRGTGPLAIHDLMEIAGITGFGRIHSMCSLERTSVLRGHPGPYIGILYRTRFYERPDAHEMRVSRNRSGASRQAKGPTTTAAAFVAWSKRSVRCVSPVPADPKM